MSPRKVYNSLEDLDDELVYDALVPIVNEPDKSELKTLFKETTQNFKHLFEDELFYKTNDDENEKLVLLILPAVRRVYSKFFIDVPQILKNNPKKVYIFQELFNLKEFLEFLSIKIIKNHNIFDDFQHIDRNAELLTIIVDDYYISKLDIIFNSDDINSLFRDTKLNKILK